MSISHVELELAREPAHPFGNREHVYDLYLPILADGRIDGERTTCCNGRCRFRCRKPCGCEFRGTLHLHGDGRLELKYGDTAASGEVRLPASDSPFLPGRTVSIADEQGEAHFFQVLFVRQE
jgi:hypothetical protein